MKECFDNGYESNVGDYWDFTNICEKQLEALDQKVIDTTQNNSDVLIDTKSTTLQLTAS